MVAAQPYEPLPRFARLRLGEPRWTEQRHALFELQRADGLLELSEIEDLATHAHESAQLPKSFLNPLLLARANGFDLLSVPTGSGQLGQHDGETIYYRRCEHPQRQGFIVGHELAHGLLGRLHVMHTHVDVQLLGIAMFGTRRDIMMLGRSLRESATLKLLRKLQPHAPVWALRLRLAMLAAGAH